MQELKSLSAGTVGPAASDPMADAVEAAQALDIDVKQLARTIALIAHGRRRGVELLESTQTSSPADSCSSRGTDTDSSSDLPHGEPLTAQSHDSDSLGHTRTPS